MMRQEQIGWRHGVEDAIKCLEARLKHYELYRKPGPMQTHPAVFATLEEQLVFLRAMLSRGTYKSTTPHDE